MGKRKTKDEMYEDYLSEGMDSLMGFSEYLKISRDDCANNAQKSSTDKRSKHYCYTAVEEED